MHNRPPFFEPSNLSEFIDLQASAIIRQMSPLEIGQMLHPDAESIPYKEVPTAVLASYKKRYSRTELKRGQFFKIGERHTFIMDHDAYGRRHKVEN